MRITWRHLFTNSVTLQYPSVKWPLPPKSRMRLFMNYEDCIGCGQCVRACPVNCISLKTEKRPADAPPIWAASGQPIKLHVSVFDIDMSLCCYCNLCTYPVPDLLPLHDARLRVRDRQPDRAPLPLREAGREVPDGRPEEEGRAGRGARGRRTTGAADAARRSRTADAAGEPGRSLTMSGEAVVFWVFATLTVASAAVVVLSRTLIYSAFALLATFFGVAGLYVLLGADFLAATQLLVYVGGILVLLLFGVMLTHKIYDLDLRSETTQLASGLLVAGGLFVILTAIGAQDRVADARAGAGAHHLRRSAGCSWASTCCPSRPRRCCCWSLSWARP